TGNQYQRLKEKDAGNQPSLNRPKAYLNFALFNDQFKLVEDNSGVRQVQEVPDQLQTLAADKIVMKESGFLYVYTSNETPQDVFFDNVAVVLEQGAVLEETHYYPFGLTMSGISNKAVYNPVNKQQLFQGQPLDDEFGLGWYGFKWRNHDPQIGRFVQIDPLANDYVHNGPYAFSENKVTSHVELEGLEGVAFIKAELWKSSGISSTTVQNVEQGANKAIANLKPFAEGVATGVKYTGITAGIIFGGPAGIILGLPALGLAVTSDVAKIIDPNNPNVDVLPGGVGEAGGLAADKLVGAVTGANTNGIFQDLGGLAETWSGGMKAFLSKPEVGLPLPIVAIDKANIVVDTYTGGKSVFEKVLNWITGEKKETEKAK
ncbi:RHS repeat-associated core domain-containing protein, partial [uncultured Chitinophaga sp.]|uniref:RHS repeat domain-containing protein n=1 Tax=uncultured Chitinophaga sp. TaxID=339340 RepID=UPI0025E425B8